jgi:uncharacterized membrane protein YhaH (DUF805 family)
VADYYFLDGARNQQGPVPADEVARLIRGGTIRRDTMVWSAGMPEWRSAGQVNDLAPLFTQAAPPPPRPSAPPPPAFPSAPPMQRAVPNAGSYQGQPRHAQAGPYNSAPSMGFIGAIKTCFSKYVDFKGRARRPEYWWWVLFNVLVGLALGIIDLVLASVGIPAVLSNLANLVFLLPSLAVGARRLHDTDRSGWWLLLWLIPLIGWIIVIVFLCQRGTEGPNRFGSDDLAVAAEFD